MLIATKKATIDLAREEFAASNLTATDISKKSGIKGDSARRILNRGGGTTEEMAQLILDTIRTLASPPPSETVTEAPAEAAQEQPAEHPHKRLTATPPPGWRPERHEDHGGLKPLTPAPPRQPPEPVRNPAFSRTAAERKHEDKPARKIPSLPVFKGIDVSEVTAEDHEISPFSVFEQSESRLEAMRRAKQRERQAREAAQESAPPRPLEATAPETAPPAEPVIEIPAPVIEAAMAGPETDLPADVPEEIVQSADETPAEISDVALRIVTSKPHEGKVRIVLEGDIPQESVNRIIALFLKETGGA